MTVRERIYAAAELIASGEGSFSCLALIRCGVDDASYVDMLTPDRYSSATPFDGVELAAWFRPEGVSRDEARAHRVIALLMFAEWIGA